MAPRSSAPPSVQHPRSSLTESGLLRSDEAGLVDALGRVQEVPRAACRRRVETNFSVMHMVDKHVAVYERAMSTRELACTGRCRHAVKRHVGGTPT